MRLGFVGTGTLSSAVIEGLLSLHGDAVQIKVSPRSDSTSRSLADRFSSVERTATNQQVIDDTEIVFIGLRPQNLTEVLSGLRFYADQTVVSFVAGADNDSIAMHVAPASRVIRVTPLPPIATRKGPIVVFPSSPDIETLFEGLGTVIVPENHRQVMTLGYAGGLMASFFEMANAGIGWMEDEGVTVQMARDYLMSMYSALGDIGLNTPAKDLAKLPTEYSTAGGINEACLNHLTAEGWFKSYPTGLSTMKRHLEALQKKEQCE